MNCVPLEICLSHEERQTYAIRYQILEGKKSHAHGEDHEETHGARALTQAKRYSTKKQMAMEGAKPIREERRLKQQHI